MKNLGYYNGKFDLVENMQIPMNDRSSWFGDGVYDATYCRNHVIYNLQNHVDRFFRSAERLKILIPHTKDELKCLLRDLVSKVDDGEQFVYWQVTRAFDGSRSHDFAEPPEKGNMWVVLTPRKINDTYRKINVITLPDTRFFHCDIKTLNLIPSVMATHEAKMKGCDEAVLHRDGRVTECAHSNVSIIKNGVFKTAPADNLILAGTARAKLIGYCEALGVRVEEEPFRLRELFDADEVIVSSSGSFCLGVDTIDGKKVGGKAPGLLKKLQDLAQSEFINETNG